MAFLTRSGSTTVLSAASELHILSGDEPTTMAVLDCRRLSGEDDGQGQVLCCASSEDCALFAVATSRKQCFVFDCTDWTKPSRTLSLGKAPTALLFVRSSLLLVADRAGNVVQYPLEGDEEAIGEQKKTDSGDEEGDGLKHGGKVIVGHVSMLLDMALSPDRSLLATADRDEKVRISRFPNAFVIRAFCLGHRQYVRSVLFWANDRIVSGDGDGVIKFWTTDGICLHTIAPDDEAATGDAQARAVNRIVHTSQQQTAATLVISFEDSSRLQVIRVVESENAVTVQWTRWLMANDIVWDIAWSANRSLMALTKHKDAPLLLWRSIAQDSDSSAIICPLDASIGQSLAKARTELPSLKKITAFNNMQDYHERKLDRIARKRKVDRSH